MLPSRNWPKNGENKRAKFPRSGGSVIRWFNRKFSDRYRAGEFCVSNGVIVTSGGTQGELSAHYLRETAKHFRLGFEFLPLALVFFLVHLRTETIDPILPRFQDFLAFRRKQLHDSYPPENTQKPALSTPMHQAKPSEHRPAFCFLFSALCFSASA
jgi:hypothetical protein